MLRPESPLGREGLKALLQDPRHALIALDYDGTLAPIVDRPQDAVPQPGVRRQVTELARRVGRIALISGRPATTVVELSGLAEVPGLVVLGQYGVQRWQAGVLREQPPVPGLELARGALPDLIADELGAKLEDKGGSLVVHVRQTIEPGRSLSRLHPRVAALARTTGLELHSGRQVLELRPAGHDKGRALRSLVEGFSCVLCAGDDVGDLAAFDAVDDLRDQGIGGLLVCSDSDDAPEELRTRADLLVPGPAGVVALLAELVAELS